MTNTKHLKTLGAKETKYPTKPDIKILETFDAPLTFNKENGCQVTPFRCGEFTSLCPKTKQPDFAKIEIVYIHRDKMVESKSLKLYLFSYRNHGAFHEAVIRQIFKDLWTVLNPLYLRVIGDFNIRGGISIKPIVSLVAPECDEQKRDILRLGIFQWDQVKGNMND